MIQGGGFPSLSPPPCSCSPSPPPPPSAALTDGCGSKKAPQSRFLSLGPYQIPPKLFFLLDTSWFHIWFPILASSLQLWPITYWVQIAKSCNLSKRTKLCVFSPSLDKKSSFVASAPVKLHPRTGCDSTAGPRLSLLSFGRSSNILLVNWEMWFFRTKEI